MDIINCDGLVKYYPSVFLNPQNLFQKLEKELAWQQDTITLYGKTHDLPRLQTFIGSNTIQYSYSGIKLVTQNWTPTTLSLKKQLDHMFQTEFNCTLCNLYRHGKDYVAWHSDDEKELGKNPLIASVSLGETRTIEFKHKSNRHLDKVRVELASGSVLLMSGPLQHHWQHQIIKTSKKISSRINLTYRRILC